MSPFVIYEFRVQIFCGTMQALWDKINKLTAENTDLRREVKNLKEKLASVEKKTGTAKHVRFVRPVVQCKSHFLNFRLK